MGYERVLKEVRHSRERAATITCVKVALAHVERARIGMRCEYCKIGRIIWGRVAKTRFQVLISRIAAGTHALGEVEIKTAPLTINNNVDDTTERSEPIYAAGGAGQDLNAFYSM